jgi:hypothetical protein
MKQAFLLFTGLILVTGSVLAQSYTSTVSYNKTQQPALVLQLPYSESVAEGFIVSNLKKTGYDAETKGKLFWRKNTIDGYYVFKGVVMPELSTPMDLYFKVDQRSKKLKDQSTISMLVSRGDEHFINVDNDENAFIAAKHFLNSFVSESASYKLNLDVEAQENVVKTAEKKFTKLQEDERDLMKKIEQLQNDLKNNRADQDKQQSTIAEERKKLTELKNKPVSF